jgi:hypothetical protein
MRRLGALRAAAEDSRVMSDDRAAIEAAIGRAAQSIDDMVDAPEDPKGLAAARAALMRVEELIARVVKERAG